MRPITRDDILSMNEYAALREDRRRAMAALKRHRRVHVGPDVTFCFENFETMLHQVHEMLAVEKGGEAQIEDELRAYNPLIPRGRELIATMMIEIDDAARRDRVLKSIGGIERTIRLLVGSAQIAAVPESDVERTTADGKTSSVHFLRFPFTDDDAAAFKTVGTRIILSIAHQNYDHMAALPEAVRAALSADLA